jgi:hypothetical protein
MFAVQIQTQGVLPKLHGANALSRHGATVILGIFRLRANQCDFSLRHRCAPLKMTDAEVVGNHVIVGVTHSEAPTTLIRDAGFVE